MEVLLPVKQLKNGWSKIITCCCFFPKYFTHNLENSSHVLTYNSKQQIQVPILIYPFSYKRVPYFSYAAVPNEAAIFINLSKVTWQTRKYVWYCVCVASCVCICLFCEANTYSQGMRQKLHVNHHWRLLIHNPLKSITDRKEYKTAGVI